MIYFERVESNRFEQIMEYTKTHDEFTIKEMADFFGWGRDSARQLITRLTRQGYFRIRVLSGCKGGKGGMIFLYSANKQNQKIYSGVEPE